MTEGKVEPGQYFILMFDFSMAERSPDINDAARYLKKAISRAFEVFYKTYAAYLGEGAINLIDPDSPAVSLERCVEKVNSAIQNEPLTDIKGVRTDCSLA